MRRNRATPDFFYVSQAIGHVNLSHVMQLRRTTFGGVVVFRNGKEENLNDEEFALVHNRLVQTMGQAYV